MKESKIYPTPLLMLAALLCLPAHGSEWRFSLALAASLLMMAFLGHVGMLAFSLDRRLAAQTFFLKCCLGQIVLFVLWLALSPLVYFFKVKLSVPLSLPAVLGALCAGLLFFRQSGVSFGRSLACNDPLLAILFTFAALCLFKIAAYYSLTVGALGLDTHQHIFFTKDLYQTAYLKITARGTNLLSDYPKGLHALAALWATPGFGAYIGPTVRVMPALQTLLITFAYIEVINQWMIKVGFGTFSRSVWLMLTLLMSFYVTFYGSRLIYPISDLNSTGRISSAAIILLPPIFGFASSLAPSRGATALNWCLLPLCGALAVKINPSLGIAYIGFSFIAWAFSTFSSTMERMKAAIVGVSVGTAIGSIIVVSDPYYISLAIAGHPALGEAMSWLGVDSPQNVVTPSTPQHGLLIRLLHASITQTMSLGGQKLTSAIYPDSALLLNSGGAAAIRSIVFPVFCVWAVLLVLLSNVSNRLVASRRALITLALAIAAGSVANVILVKIVIDTLGRATHDTNLLATYALGYEPLLSMFLVQIVLALAVTFAIDTARIVLNDRVRDVVTRNRLIALAAISAICFAVVLISGKTYLPEASKLGWWNPIDQRSIREFNTVEESLPRGALILADAVPAKLNGVEEWILPVGLGAAYLPFAENNYVFNVRLGSGLQFNYDDIYDNFCTGSPNAARSFLKKNNIRYLFSPAPESMGEDAVLSRTFCTVSYRDLGVKYPAKFTGKYGIAFYEIEWNSRP